MNTNQNSGKSDKELHIDKIRHSSNFHAKQIVKKLISRPNLKDDDGFFDIIADQQQMIEIVQKYLDRHYY